jgi:hypothetical protein
VVEDQQRGLPHEHVVCPHTTALEIAFTRAFFDALPRATRHHQLGNIDRYKFALAKQGRYHAREFHGYLAKLARYLAKSSSAGEFLRKHHGERVFYVAPWLSRLSGVTMTVARICRHVWAARRGYCDMPKSKPWPRRSGRGTLSVRPPLSTRRRGRTISYAPAFGNVT